MCTVEVLVNSAAEQFGARPAVEDDHQSLSFRELRNTAAATAAALRRAGVRRGDRVGVCMAKSADQAVAVLGVLLADAILVPVLPKLKREGVAHIVGDSGMCLMITDEARAREVIDAVPGLPLLYGQEAEVDPELNLPWLRTQRYDAIAGASIGSDVAAVIYSSGSTGRPKGIMITHRNITDGARITADYLGTSAEDRIGSLLSLNFDYGLNQLWQSLLTGACLCLHELVFPADAFRFLFEQRITVLPVMPVIITRLFDPRLLRRRPTCDLSSVRYVSTSGGAVSQRMLDELAATFPAARVFLMYGLTEAFRSTYLEPDQLSQRPDSIGKAIPDVEILVLDEELREVGPGEPGELVHRGGCVSKGYWNAPEATAARFRTLPQFPGERVVFSGDIVTRDNEGFLYFAGRRDAMIKTLGFRVSPTEVEDIAARFPEIAACAAVGVPNVEIGEEIALFYSATGTVAETEYRHFLKDRLPSHMVPRHLWQRDTLPSTGNDGKIDRQALAAEAIDLLHRVAKDEVSRSPEDG
ncbi:AMP-binding protein [Streptomyces sp. NA02950]|uniref:AMP-binding protein n=1 Tax=Streptomyces sp. NA02950 TaxID=2742137 RepID=UPI0015921F97|nr:AMP-binding protein [Streptomyces sp. NA02950]QKV96370.1 AMP-binding protein [Streptomyces sp. NA02950]